MLMVPCRKRPLLQERPLGWTYSLPPGRVILRSGRGIPGHRAPCSQLLPTIPGGGEQWRQALRLDKGHSHCRGHCTLPGCSLPTAELCPQRSRA